MALSAVNILHLNGPLEAKQTQTDLHTNDRRGPGVNVSLCVCVWMHGRNKHRVLVGGTWCVEQEGSVCVGLGG